MDKKSKRKLGQRVGGSIYFTDREKLEILKDYLSSNESKNAIYYKYTGRRNEHGTLLRWMRKFGIEDKYTPHNQFRPMADHSTDNEDVSKDFETLKLKKRIEDLEQRLKDAEMKSIAMSTMVDIAERELNISIRKKYATKPSKK